MNKRIVKPTIVAGLAAFAVMILGGLATPIGPWYGNLVKPGFNPPNWVFAPVWTVIFALAVVAAVRGWGACGTNRERSWLISLFFINAALNVLWSLLFFSAQRPDWALAEVITLWMSVLSLILFLGRRDRWAARALWPYLIWVSFAGYLNIWIVVLNAPFG